jgi:hypothetical protein
VVDSQVQAAKQQDRNYDNGGPLCGQMGSGQSLPLAVPDLIRQAVEHRNLFIKPL